MNSTILNNNPRTHIVGVQAYQNTLGARATIGLAYLLMFWACTLPFFAIDTIAWLGEEDGPIENTGALLFLLGGAIFFVTAYRASGLHRQCGTSHIESPLALSALGGLLFVCAGEEVSWGQRLFDYPIPTWVKTFNRQHEWNLHNLAWFHAQTAEGTEKSFWARMLNMDRLLACFQLTLCTLVPVFTAYSTSFATWMARIRIPVVPLWIAGLVPVHFVVSQALYAIVGDQLILGDTLDETKETARAIIFFFVAISAYQRLAPDRISQ